MLILKFNLVKPIFDRINLHFLVLSLFRSLMLALTISLRYLISLRRASTIQILSVLSFFGILLGSMAMIVVLSAYNGFESLLKDIYHFQDPDLKITVRQGKSFVPDVGKWQKIKGMARDAHFFEVLSDKAAIRYNEGQMVVEILGVQQEFLQTGRMDTLVDQGKLAINIEGEPTCLISMGIRESLNINLKSQFDFLQILYPKQKKLLKPGLTKIFNTLNLRPSGILKMDENRIFIPLDEARILMERPLEISQLQVFIPDKSRISEIQKRLMASLGSEFVVQNETEQHADLFKVVQMERLFVILALGFIILISSFNLFVSMSMLVIDKQRDIRILSALGMRPGKIRLSIQLTGAWISVFGLVTGLALGAFICWLQSVYGFVPLGMNSTHILAYPVDIQWVDFFIVAIWVMLSAILSLIYPGIKVMAFSRRFRHI